MVDTCCVFVPTHCLWTPRLSPRVNRTLLDCKVQRCLVSCDKGSAPMQDVNMGKLEAGAGVRGDTGTLYFPLIFL